MRVAAALIKAERRFQIAGGDGPAIRPAQQSIDDLARAGQLFLLILRGANEDLGARWRLARAGRIERPFHGETVHRRIAHDVQSINGSSQKRLDQVVFLGMTSQNGGRGDYMGAGLQRNANRQLFVEIGAE